MKKKKIGIYRIIAYFIIYSILGFLIETIYALVVYGKLESRQGFLYGPFCPIYGVGAVVIIYSLRNLEKNFHKLFLGGFIVGGAVEYLISVFGELVLNVQWWDYSDKFLNINGRICVAYCCFWGILTIYLLKVLNPMVDKLIKKIKGKFNIKNLKRFTIILAIFFILDAIISTIAVNAFSAKTIIENDLPSKNRARYEKTYNYFYTNEKREKIADKIWGEKIMIKIYPNLRITLEDGSMVYVQDYYKEIKPYYLKLKD